jgi:hypothetical protein
MARSSGKHIKVKADGTTVGYIAAWEMSDDISTTSHFGAGQATPDTSVVSLRKRGSFTCESDPADSLQESLHEGVIIDELRLYETSTVYHVINNALITQSISADRAGKPVRVFSWIEAGGGGAGGQFSLNGGVFGSVPDPEVTFQGQDVYGSQLTLLIFGPFETYALNWQLLTDAAFTELRTRINSTNGERVDMTLPITSATSWSSVYGCVRLTGFQRSGLLVSNVSVEATKVSTTA